MNQDELKRYAALKQIPLGTVEKDYVLSVVLMHLSKSEYARKVIFKGGTAIKKVYFPEARFSVDLDFNFFDILADQLVKEISMLFGRKKILEVDFEEVARKETTENKVLLRLEYKAQLNHLDSVMLDLVFKEPVLTETIWWIPKDDYDVARKLTCEHLAARQMYFGKLYYYVYDCKHDRMRSVENRKYCLDCRMEAPRRSDPLPSAFKAMSLEEILSEKVRACLVRGRPRDLYDMWFLQSKGIKLDRQMIVDKLRLYREFKETIPSLKQIGEQLRQIEPEWNRDLEALIPSRSFPTFEESLKNAINGLRNSGWKE